MSQNLILLTNSKNTTPASFDDASQFTVNFPTVLHLPAHCEMCLGACSVVEATPANVGRIHYVALSNLPIGSQIANAREGSFSKIIGAFQSEVSTLMPNRWCSLHNTDPISLSSIDVRLVNQDQETEPGLQNNTSLVVYYRQAKMHKC